MGFDDCPTDDCPLELVPVVLLLFSNENPESFEEARGGGLVVAVVVRCGELCLGCPPDAAAGDALWEFALWFESVRWSFIDLTEDDRCGSSVFRCCC